MIFEKLPGGKRQARGLMMSPAGFVVRAVAACAAVALTAAAVALLKACQLPGDMDRLSPQIRHQLSPDDFARMWDDIIHNY